MSKRVIPRAVFEPLSGVQASDLIDNPPLLNMIRNETPPAIEEAFRAKKTFATIFEINTSGYYVDIPRMYWIPALEECIKLNLVDEKYEECLKLNNLIEEIKTAKKKPIKQKNGERTKRDSASDQ